MVVALPVHASHGAADGSVVQAAVIMMSSDTHWQAAVPVAQFKLH